MNVHYIYTDFVWQVIWIENFNWLMFHCLIFRNLRMEINFRAIYIRAWEEQRSLNLQPGE